VRNREIYRPTSAYFLVGTTYLFCALYIGVNWWQEGWRTGVVALAWGALICALAFAILGYPKITLFDEGISITNPLRTVTVGWHEVEEIEARYSMSILVNGKTIHAWAAPAPGRYHGRTVHASEIRGLNFRDTSQLRPGESPRTESGTATQLARIRLEHFRKVGNIVGASQESTTHKKIIASIAATLFLSLIVTLMHL